MNDDGGGDLATPAATDVPALLTTCRQRVLEREGIAMFIALKDSRPGCDLVVRDRTARTEGIALGRLFDHYRDGLANDPNAAAPPDDPTGARALINVLVVLSDRHLRAPDGVDAP